MPAEKDNDDIIRQHDKQVAVIWDVGLVDFEDANTSVVEAEDVDIVTKASDAYIDVDAIVDNNKVLSSSTVIHPTILPSKHKYLLSYNLL